MICESIESISKEVKRLNNSSQTIDLNGVYPFTLKQFIYGKRNLDIVRICIRFKDIAQLNKFMFLSKGKLYDFSCVKTGDRQVEVLNKQWDKASSCLRLIENIGLDPSNVIVIGNDYNDICLFKTFQNSYCVNCYNPEINRYAAYKNLSIDETLNIIERRIHND